MTIVLIGYGQNCLIQRTVHAQKVLFNFSFIGIYGIYFIKFVLNLLKRWFLWPKVNQL